MTTLLQQRTVSTERPVTLGDLRRIFRRRRSVIVSCLGLSLTAAALVCIFSTRRYQATGEIQVQKDSVDALGLDNMMRSVEEASDALNANITLQTQADLLQSDTLALHAITALNLEQTPDFKSKLDPISWMMTAFAPSAVADSPRASLEDSPRRRERALKIFRSHLSVRVVSGTRLIEIRFLSSDPRAASAVVNELMRGLVEYTFQTRFDATNLASAWLTGQLSDLKKQAEDLQAKVVALQRQSGVVSLGVQDAQGHDQAYSVVVDRLQQATATLSQATSNRILKGAFYKIVQSGDAELISGLSANGMVSSSPTLNTSLSLIQSLRMQEAAVQGQIAQDAEKYGPSYPRLVEARANLAELEKAIRNEVNRVAERAKNDYEVARRAEEESHREFAQQKRQADALNDKAIEFAIVRQEAEESRGLYEDLLKRLKEAGVLESLRSSNITVVDPGRTPSLPKQPNVPVYLGLSLCAGLLIGISSAFILDSIDDKILAVEAIEHDLELSPLGILPRLHEPAWYRQLAKPSSPRVGSGRSGVDGLFVFANPSSAYTEALRSLKTALIHCRNSPSPQVLLVTSSVAAEGKSLLSANLSAVLAHGGKRVLLVEADLRKPSLDRRFGLDSRVGLGQFLSDGHQLEDIVDVPGLPKLHLLTAGPTQPYSDELLASEKMQEAVVRWRKDYDFIVFDSPPVLPVPDAVLLANISDMTLLVARHGKTTKLSLARSHRTLLEQAGQNRVGIVLNGVSRQSAFYYEYYGYSSGPRDRRLHQGGHADA